jgi:hypothetical protein
MSTTRSDFDARGARVFRALQSAPAVQAAGVFAASFVVGLLPLFGGPGYESSLAGGLVLPSVAGITTALAPSASGMDPGARFGQGVRRGGMLAGAWYLGVLAQGLRVGFCDLRGGTVQFLLTAGIGALLGGVWGALVAPLAADRRRRRLWCVLLGIAAPLAGVIVSLARFYTSPMVFAYDPFFGYFSGTLYDTVVDVRTELWTYRAGSLLTIAGAGLVMSGLPASGQRSVVRLASGALLLAASLVHCAFGPELGHWQTADTIARSLGGRSAGERCDVVHPDSLSPAQAHLLVRDCEQELSSVEQRLGARYGGRLTAFVFEDADQKRRLMGAADVSIAKPWRHELYVQMAPYPHPVIGHEIAHVVAGSFARGPFRVAGSLGGLWPNPGLIEGTAVAASPDDDELTDAQWARAMLELSALPAPSEIFSLGFLGQSADKSYTVAGAFVGWVLDRWGPGVVRAWYGGASIEVLTGRALAALDEEFRAWLRALPMPEQALTYARARFERPSVWRRTCPHVVDALNRKGDQCRDQQRSGRALALYADALARDPHDWHARFESDRVALRTRDPDAVAEAKADLQRLASDAGVPQNWRDRAVEALADADALEGRDAAAADGYRAVASRTLDEDAARTLEVKALGVSDPSARQAVVDLLIGEGEHPPDAWVGAFTLGRWAAGAPSALAAYLAGKNLGRHDQWVRSASWLDDALTMGLPTERIGREALRQRVIAACVLEDSDALQRLRQRIEAADSAYSHTAGGRKEWLLRLCARCAGR